MEKGCQERRGEIWKRGARSTKVSYGRGVPRVQRTAVEKEC